MRFTRPAPARFDLRALHVHLEAAGVAGFTGVSIQGDDLHVEFPEREALGDDEAAAIAAAFDAYVFVPTWDAVRAARAPLLAEADWRIARAEDLCEPETEAALRFYRQALRDMTQGPDPENPVWPVRPWS